MTSNRREFLQLSGLAAMGKVLGWTSRPDEGHRPHSFQKKYEQVFNMSGYAAPALDEVRIGIIGIGNRGRGTAHRLARIEGANIKALCDIVPEKVSETIEEVREHSHNPDSYTDGSEDWKRMCERDDLDLIYICTPWDQHVPQAVFSMEHDKHVATEIPAAQTVEGCWQLVETSEKTKKHCIQLTNVCYGTFEMVTLNMARQGLLGEIIHGDGAYIHELIEHNFSDTYYENFWRLKEHAERNGNLYPHHGLGTIAQMMNINHGDKMEYMVSMSGGDFQMQERARKEAEEDSFFDQFTDKNFGGNMNSSIIKTNQGRTIMLQHDVTSPRPYTRIHQVSGTEGTVRAFPEAMVSTSHHGWLEGDEQEELIEKYTPEIEKKVGEMAREIGGHGGMDTIMNWRLIDCLRSGIAPDMNVYDAALWSAIVPLSEWSVANYSSPVEIPDFTCGAWKSNEPGMDINLEKGGTTSLH